MILSRRTFLQIFGITAAAQLPWPNITANAAPAYSQLVAGRTLAYTPTYTLPSQTSTVQSYLWPDVPVAIHDSSPGWYQTSSGYVPAAAIQPIYTPAEKRQQAAAAFPFVAEVRATVAPIRAYCSPNAPIKTRVAHGGMMHVTDKLIDDQQQSWYEVTNADESPLGWALADHWQVYTLPTHYLTLDEIHVNRAAHSLTALSGKHAVFSTQATLPHNLPGGVYTYRKTAPGGSRITDRGMVYHGVPYRWTHPAMPALHAIYWHNQFNAPTSTSTIHINLLVGKWLYEWGRSEISVSVI